jgi:hypothetical protein
MKLKIFLKEVNGLALSSLLISIVASVVVFCIDTKYWYLFGEIGGLSSTILGVTAVILIWKNKQRGLILAILGIILGILTWTVCETVIF